MGTEYNKYHLSECMKIVILLKGGMFEIFYDLRCFAMFRKFLLSTHFTNRAKNILKQIYKYRGIESSVKCFAELCKKEISK